MRPGTPTGSVGKYVNPSGRVVWRYRINLAGDERRRRVLSKSGFSTRRAAAAAMAERVASLERGAPMGSPPTLANYLAEDFLPGVARTVTTNTLATYRAQIRGQVIPVIGGVPLDRVTPGRLDHLYASLEERGLAPKTIRNVHALLHRALAEAAGAGWLGSNPASRAHPPKVGRQQPKVWTASELGRFLDHMADHRLGALWRLLATTGMRRGEALGLTWEALDLERGALSITQTVLEESGKVVIQPRAKTAAGSRRIALDPATMGALRDHRVRQLTERLAWGAGYRDHGLVFSRENGAPLRPSSVTRQLQKAAGALELAAIGPHGLRHTWATLALVERVPVKVVSERLGHASTSITLDVYSHVVPGMDAEAAAAIADVIDRRD
jgi:integrase